MPKVGIVTDSLADIPDDLAAELGIVVVRCQVHVGRQTFLDGIELTKADAIRLLREGPPYPTTASPPVGAFVEAYRQLAQQVDHIVSIHLASNLSTLYNAARLAIEMVPEIDVTLVDSRQLTMCTGWLAIAAARAAQSGASVDEIKRLVQDLIPRLRLVGVIDDLSHLARSGRVGLVTSLLGTALRIKPIFQVQEGQVGLLEKARTRRKAMARLVKHVAAYGPLEQAVVLHLDAPKQAAELAEQIARYLPGYPLGIAEAGVAIGTHLGPGCVGLALVLANGHVA
ncbi:MAG: DegV family protein [Chloroflexi bacterium]|nr:DegV family protein [Chloroflexota bacterium]